MNKLDAIALSIFVPARHVFEAARKAKEWNRGQLATANGSTVRAFYLERIDQAEDVATAMHKVSPDALIEVRVGNWLVPYLPDYEGGPAEDVSGAAGWEPILAGDGEGPLHA